jgi:hypothetical protein
MADRPPASSEATAASLGKHVIKAITRYGDRLAELMTVSGHVMHGKLKTITA